MRYVKLTTEQANKIPNKEKGFTSGRKDENGKRENIVFCSSLAFVKVFGFDAKREFIEI